jgi:hypothetical protein
MYLYGNLLYIHMMAWCFPSSAHSFPLSDPVCQKHAYQCLSHTLSLNLFNSSHPRTPPSKICFDSSARSGSGPGRYAPAADDRPQRPPPPRPPRCRCPRAWAAPSGGRARAGRRGAGPGRGPGGSRRGCGCRRGGGRGAGRLRGRPRAARASPRTGCARGATHAHTRTPTHPRTPTFSRTDAFAHTHIQFARRHVNCARGGGALLFLRATARACACVRCAFRRVGACVPCVAMTTGRTVAAVAAAGFGG